MTSPLRIMLVEDERLIAMSVQMHLEDMGHVVCASVDTAEAALDCLDGARPNLVILDIRLRGAMDGTSLARELRSRGPMPIIICSAFDGRALDPGLADLPGVAFLRKPLELETLDRLIGQMASA